MSLKPKIHKILKVRLLLSFPINDISWKAILSVTLLSVIVYSFSEWIFIITKPSFLNQVPFFGKLFILGFSISFIYTGCLILLLFLALLERLFYPRGSMLCKLIGLFIPTFLVTSLLLMLFDNFTYTVFRFGVVSTNFWRIGYIVALLVLFYYLLLAILQKTVELTAVISKYRHQKIFTGVVLILTSLVILLAILTKYNNSIEPPAYLSDENRNLPNIILITADGLDALHTSVYGYDRQTTPRIQEMKNISLISENAFTNSGNTAGSFNINVYRKISNYYSFIISSRYFERSKRLRAFC